MTKKYFTPSADFKDKIKDVRTKLNFTQSEFAEILKVSVSTVQNWETGRALPRIYTCKLIVSLLDLSKEEIVALFPQQSNKTVDVKTDANDGTDEILRRRVPLNDNINEVDDSLTSSVILNEVADSTTFSVILSGTNGEAKELKNDKAETVPRKLTIREKWQRLHPVLKTLFRSICVWFIAWVILFVIILFFMIFTPIESDGETIAYFKRFFSFDVFEFLWAFCASFLVISGIPVIIHIFIRNLKK